MVLPKIRIRLRNRLVIVCSNIVLCILIMKHIPISEIQVNFQVYVMFSLECPLVTKEIFGGHQYEKYNNFFNWTMTYRKDSDLFAPYGWVVPLSNPIQAPPSSPSSDHTQLNMPLESNAIGKSNYMNERKLITNVNSCITFFMTYYHFPKKIFF